MRLRRQMKETILPAEEVNVGEVSDSHGHQISMAQHRALWLAGCAARIEDPCQVFGAPLGDAVGIDGDEVEPILLSRHNEPHAPWQQSGDRLCDVRGRETKPRAAILNNVGEFAGVQLGVRRHSDQSGAPDRE